MNKHYIILISAILISIGVLLFGCKKDDDDNPQKGNTQNGLEEKLTTNLNALRDAAIVYNEELQQSGDTVAAFIALNNWLVNHPEVKQGWFHNVEFLEVEFNNGLKSSINIIPVGENGVNLTRGGGASGNPVAFRVSNIQSREIKNNKVLILIPYPEEFSYSSTEIQNLETLIQSGSEDMEVNIQVGSEVDYHDLATFGDYGLIILDVHGVKYGFVLAHIDKAYGPDDLWFPEDVINAAFNVHSIPQAKVANGQIEIGLHIYVSQSGYASFKFTVLITEDCIRQMNVDLSDAIVFGNHCYSGHTADGPAKYNLSEAWRSLGAAVYYGYADADNYSAPVWNDFCQEMEKNLIRGLIVDGDTTGSAHLQPDGSEYFQLPGAPYRRLFDTMTVISNESGSWHRPTVIWPLYLVQYFDKDYEYESCGDDLVDSRDQEVYKTVCIGEQTWMAEDLNYETGNSWCYDNNSIYCDSIGRLYDWASAMDACPQGWHVPTEAEWQTLVSELGGSSVAGGKLKAESGWNSPNTGATNSSGFSALGSGWYNPSNGFGTIGGNVVYWTSSEVDANTVHGVMLSTGSASVSFTEFASKTSGYSCRCIKNH